MKKTTVFFLFFTLISTVLYGQKPQLKLPIGHTGGINSVCFSPDGRYALSGSADKTLKLWDIQNEKEIKSFEGHADGVNSVCFSPDGKYALSGSSDKTLKLWDIQSGKEIRSYEGHTDGVTSVCFSPNGEYAVSLSSSILILWNIKSGTKIKKIKKETFFNSVCFSPDGRHIIFSYNDYLYLWDFQNGNEFKSFKGHTKYVDAVCISPDGNFALSATGRFGDKTMTLWDVQRGKEIITFKGHTRSINSVYISPNGKYIMTSTTKAMKLWDMQIGKEIKTFNVFFPLTPSIYFSPDFKYFISCSAYETFTFWNIQSGKEIKSFQGSSAVISSVAFSPNGSYALTGSMGALKLWDMQTEKVIESLNGPSKSISAISFSPDNRHVLSGSFDETFRLWDVKGIEESISLEIPGFVESVSFSPDGIYALSGSGFFFWENPGKGDFMKLWDVQSGKEIKSFQGHTKSVSSVCFSPDGKYGLSGSLDETLKLWDVQTGKEIKTFKGHTSQVNSVCFSPDGRFALSGSQDNTTKVWDIQNGKELATLISVDSSDWIVTTTSGLFDASEGAMKQMYFVAGMEIIEFDQLKKRYWQPGLLPILLGYCDKKLREVPVFDFVRLWPEKELTIDNGELTIKLKNRGGGIGRVNVFIDNIQVIADARLSPNDSSKENLTLGVDLSRFSDLLNYGQENVVKVITWNAEDYISSRADTIHYIPHRKDAKGIEIVSTPDIPMSRPALWAVVVGTSDYSGSAINLHYAAKDAIDFANALTIGANRLFGADSTHITLLTTEKKDMYPTKANIEKAFQQLKHTLPKDIVVVYFSGHGVNYGSGDGDFYYLTADASSTDAEYFSDPAMSYNYSVSGTELVKWLQVPARKKLVLLDACAAGRGAETMAMAIKDSPKSQERILDQMQTLGGLYILAGAAGDKSSYESSRYGQGLLTYSLLKGMQGAQLKKEGGEEYVDVPLLLHYAVNEVPRLAQEEGYNQQPFVRSPDVQSLLYIGRMTEEDKKMIVLSEPKPVFISSKFQNSDLLAMDIRLEDQVNAQLREITAKGRMASLTFREGTVPSAYQIRGQYTLLDDTIKVKYILTKDNAIVGQQMESLCKSKDLEELTKEIVLKAGNLAK